MSILHVLCKRYTFYLNDKNDTFLCIRPTVNIVVFLTILPVKLFLALMITNFLLNTT